MSDDKDLLLGATQIAAFLTQLFDGEEITDVIVWE